MNILAATGCALFLLVAACQSPQARTPSPGDTAGASRTAPGDTAGVVQLRVDSDRYVPGAPITLTLENRSDARYAFNACSRVVEQEAGGGWRAVEEPGRMCTAEAMLLEPRVTRTAPTELPAVLDAGRYRVAVELMVEGTPPPMERVRAVSAPFTVGAR